MTLPLQQGDLTAKEKYVRYQNLTDPGPCVNLLFVKRSELRHRDICSAAIAEFSERGYVGASMANIAARAQISRPALYQYFDNKADIFASAFISLFEGLVKEATAALELEGSLAERLDEFLQRYTGDLWQHLAASQFADEIIQAKTDDRVAASVEVVPAIVEPLWIALDQHLTTYPAGRGPGGAKRRSEWVNVLRHGSKGCWTDKPPIDVYRQRLSVLARSIATDIETATND